MEHRRGRSLSIRRVAAALAVALLATTAAPAQDDFFAIGDVHGSLDGLRTILRETGLIDSDDRWVGGAATLVQTGDVLDRGADVRAVMDLLMRLQLDARAAGGLLVVLLGNHEAMNLQGDLSDVNPEAYAAFADRQSEARREKAWRQYRRHWTRRTAQLGQAVEFTAEDERRWFDAHPPGMLEYAHAVGPDGVYGRWLRELPAAFQDDDTLFVHGGWGPALGGMTVAAVNRAINDERASFDELRAFMVAEGLAFPWSSIQALAGEARRELDAWQAELGRWRGEADRLRAAARLGRIVGWQEWLLNREDGPLWFRGAATWNDDAGAAITRLLDELGVSRMVVGHSPMGDARIHGRFGDRVFLIDTGMLGSEYGGRPSALHIRGGRVTAVYPGQGEAPVEDGIELPLPPGLREPEPVGSAAVGR